MLVVRIEIAAIAGSRPSSARAFAETNALDTVVTDTRRLAGVENGRQPGDQSGAGDHGRVATIGAGSHAGRRVRMRPAELPSLAPPAAENGGRR